jgi:hypothetical protein
MDTLTLKLPQPLMKTLKREASRARVSQSEWARRAIAAYAAHPASGDGPPALPQSALDQVADLVGVFEGGPKDLASNPKHLAGFGNAGR